MLLSRFFATLLSFTNEGRSGNGRRCKVGPAAARADVTGRSDDPESALQIACPGGGLVLVSKIADVGTLGQTGMDFGGYWRAKIS
jgi:hypothetical protein